VNKLNRRTAKICTAVLLFLYCSGEHGSPLQIVNGFTQCHACVVQTTTRYAGVHKKLYKKITNRITIRMFKSIVKKKGDFNGK